MFLFYSGHNFHLISSQKRKYTAVIAHPKIIKSNCSWVVSGLILTGTPTCWIMARQGRLLGWFRICRLPRRALCTILIISVSLLLSLTRSRWRMVIQIKCKHSMSPQSVCLQYSRLSSASLDRRRRYTLREHFLFLPEWIIERWMFNKKTFVHM